MNAKTRGLDKTCVCTFVDALVVVSTCDSINNLSFCQ